MILQTLKLQTLKLNTRQRRPPSSHKIYDLSGFQTEVILPWLIPALIPALGLSTCWPQLMSLMPHLPDLQLFRNWSKSNMHPPLAKATRTPRSPVVPP